MQKSIIVITVLKITMLMQVTGIAYTHPMTSAQQLTLEYRNVWSPSLRGAERVLGTDWLKEKGTEEKE